MSLAKRSRPVKRDRPVTSFTLTPEAINLLDDVVKSLGVSRSAVVEMMVRRFASEMKPPRER